MYRRMDEQTDGESAMKMEGDESARWHFKNSFFDGLFLNSKLISVIYLIVHPSIFLSVCVFLHAFIDLSIHWSSDLYVHLLIHVAIALSLTSFSLPFTSCSLSSSVPIYLYYLLSLISSVTLSPFFLISFYPSISYSHIFFCTSVSVSPLSFLFYLTFILRFLNPSILLDFLFLFLLFIVFCPSFSIYFFSFITVSKLTSFTFLFLTFSSKSALPSVSIPTFFLISFYLLSLISNFYLCLNFHFVLFCLLDLFVLTSFYSSSAFFRPNCWKRQF